MSTLHLFKGQSIEIGAHKKNLWEFLRTFRALFQEKDMIFVQESCDEVGCVLDKTTSSHLNLPIPAGQLSLSDDWPF